MLMWWEEMFLRGRVRFCTAQGLLSPRNDPAQSRFLLLPLPPSILTCPFLACGMNLLMSRAKRQCERQTCLYAHWGYLVREKQDVCSVCLARCGCRSQLSLLGVTQKLIDSIF